MLAAYTFSSAQELTEFCARHRIGRDDTYSVLQSAYGGITPQDYGWTEVRLTVVLDASGTALHAIAQREQEHSAAQAQAESARARQSAEEDARGAEEQRRVQQQRQAAQDDLYPDGIPF